MFAEIHCIVQGRVQGVGFRDFVERHASEYELYGWIKNTPEGHVEIVLQGIPDTLKDCIEALHQGPSLARVESVSVEWKTPEKLFDEFMVIAQ